MGMAHRHGCAQVRMVSMRVAIRGPARRAELRSGYACAPFRPPPRRRRGLLPKTRVLMGMPQTLEPPLPRAAPTATEEAFLYIFKPQKCQTFRGRRQQARARGDYVVFLNNDTIVTAQW